jgi:uncharacterized protein (TIGR00251 family)
MTDDPRSGMDAASDGPLHDLMRPMRFFCPSRIMVRMRIEADGDDVLVWVKAVPGASRDEIAGVLGGRLKVRVAAPPEGGKANRAIAMLLARAIGVKAGRVSHRERAEPVPRRSCGLRGAAWIWSAAHLRSKSFASQSQE